MTGPLWIEGVSLAPMTSWRIGGPARAFAEPATPEKLIALRREAEKLGWPVFLIGGGSNILIADEGYSGLVIRYADRLHRIDTRGSEARIWAGARMPLARLARESAQQGWAGLVWAEGIPGTIAGAIVGNAGAYGGDIASVLEEVEIVLPDGALETWPAARLAHGYRRSILKGQEPTGPVITGAVFRMVRDDPVRLNQEVQRIAAERRARTPVGASCGSVFRNPPGGPSAGRLLEEAGCKLMQCGGAVVSDIHANYIVNKGGATARDIISLIDEIRSRVRAASGIELDLEIQLVGFRDSC